MYVCIYVCTLSISRSSKERAHLQWPSKGPIGRCGASTRSMEWMQWMDGWMNRWATNNYNWVDVERIATNEPFGDGQLLCHAECGQHVNRPAIKLSHQSLPRHFNQQLDQNFEFTTTKVCGRHNLTRATSKRSWTENANERSIQWLVPIERRPFCKIKLLHNHMILTWLVQFDE